MMKTTLFERYIESKQMTMQELAARLGYTPQYLSLIRHGHFPITGNFIAKACLRLGHNISDLFFDDTPEELGNSHSEVGSENIRRNS